MQLNLKVILIESSVSGRTSHIPHNRTDSKASAPHRPGLTEKMNGAEMTSVKCMPISKNKDHRLEVSKISRAEKPTKEVEGRQERFVCA